MTFTWDDDKNAANREKHGISFETATRIFDGPMVTTIDGRFDYGKERRISIGRAGSLLVIVVVHTARDGTTRIISARHANRNERRRYHEFEQGPA